MLLKDFWAADKQGWTPLEKLLVAFFLWQERTTKQQSFSREEIRMFVNGSPRSISRAVKRLKDKGVIDVIPQQRKDGGTIGNLYKVKPLKKRRT